MPRHLDERLLLASPRLSRRLARFVLALPPGSAVRRRILKRAAKRGWEAVARGDEEAALVLVERDYELNMFGDEFLGLGFDAQYRGHAGMIEFVRSWRAAWTSIDYAVDELLDMGDRIVLRFTTTSRGMASGVDVTATAGSVYYLGTESIVRQDFYFNWSECARALGLPDEAARAHA
jgi:hypothetical protein